MTTTDKYTIDYQSMTNGTHSLDLTVDGGLFEAMESNEIMGGECRVHVGLVKSEAGLDAVVSLDGDVTVECDRCLEPCSVPVKYEGELKVRFSDEVKEYDGEQLWLAWGEKLSLAQYLYESVVVSLPYRRVHPDGGCNPEMMARFTPCTEQEGDESGA